MKIAPHIESYGIWAERRDIMKWFKHYSTARNDEKISRLEDKAGLEAYGFYFKMLEVVAEAIDETDKHDVTYSITRWGRQLNVSTKKFLFLLQCCSDVGLMFVQRDADDVTVKIPNLLKIRDNHTKNLQAKSKQDKEEDKEVEQKQIININCPHQEIVDLYHKNLPMLPKVKLWTSKRANTLKLRWSEDKSRQSLEFWDNLFTNIAKSDFLTGKTSQWRADLEWIINPSNLVKILEGKYDNRDVTPSVKHDASSWRHDDASILKKAASLGVYTSGKSRFEIVAAIDKKEGRI